MDISGFPCPTPFTPPQTDGEALDWLRLIRSRRVGPATFHRLLEEHGTAEAALAALPALAAKAGVSDYAPCPEAVARAELRAGAALGARLLFHGQPGYPSALVGLPDAPPLLWARGNLSFLARPCLGIVGARSASALGNRMARKLAEGLAEQGFTVVSGMARGIDAAAHDGALSGGTIAVMAGGVDVLYPPENRDLFARILDQGLIVSELPPGVAPQARHFPARNRIIAGLSRAVIVVEAAGQSGSLQTARLALDAGREVMAVPGHPFDGRASGCNMLIRDGATLVRGPEDVVAALGLSLHPRAPLRAITPLPQPKEPAERAEIPPPPAQRRDRAETFALHQQILQRLGPSPVPEDQLLRDMRLATGQLAPELLKLELEGQIIRQAGGLLSRAV